MKLLILPGVAALSCAALTALLTGGQAGGRTLLVFLLVTVWGLRLMLHISFRNRERPILSVL